MVCAYECIRHTYQNFSEDSVLVEDRYTSDWPVYT